MTRPGPSAQGGGTATDNASSPDPSPSTPATPSMPSPASDGLDRPVALVGLMGAGKTVIGRRLAARLGVPFVDADHEIERAADCTVAEIFERFGEAEFRAGEARVIARLLEGGPSVIATGGGAFMTEGTRALIKDKAVSLWLKAGLDLLVHRTTGRPHRPLLNTGDPRRILGDLMARRYPVYAEADVTVEVFDESPEITTQHVLAALETYLSPRPSPSSLPDRSPRVTTAETDTLTVSLGERSYDILIGQTLLAEAGRHVAAVARGRRAFVVTDENVAPHYLTTVLESLSDAGFTCHKAILPPGEQTKSMHHLGSLLDAMLEARLERSSMVVALGGGVIGDLAGFAASVLLRGVDFVQIPTTLLSQVDSSVGGKTGLNVRQGKNLVGAFHQPRLVLVDTETLGTLPHRELLAGYAEVAKYGLIDDAPFWDWLEKGHGEAVVGLDADAVGHAIHTSCTAKARVVAADERESGQRALLNLGHTFGHALEAEGGYGGPLLHGEAVAVGMVMAFDLSVALGLCPAADAARVRAHLASIGLRVDPPKINGAPMTARNLLDHMGSDKKVEAGRLTFVLAAGIGQAFLSRDVPTERVLALLEKAVSP